MKKLGIGKTIWISLLALLSLTLGLVFLPTVQIMAAGPPGDPPSPTFELKIKPEETQPSAGSLISPADVIADGLVTFYTTADAQILQGTPATNYGIGSPMRTGHSGCLDDPPGVARSLVRFDLSHVPPGTIINNARLLVDLAGSCDFPGQSLSITPYQISSDWSEEDVTWSTQPSLGSSYPSVSIPHAAWGWYSFDITNLVQKWVSGTSNYGIMLRGPEATSGWRGFSTKANGRYSYGPRLEVNLVVPPATLSTSPTSLLFNNDIGGPATQTKELAIQNLGDNTLNWSASESISWLSLDKTNGATQFTLPDTPHVTVNKSGLSPGHYTGQIQVTSNPPGAPGSPKLVEVAFDLVQSLPRVYLPVMLKSGSSLPAQKYVGLFIGISDYEYMAPPAAKSFGRAGAPGNDIELGNSDSIAMASEMSEEGGLCDSSAASVTNQSLLPDNTKILQDSWATKEAIHRAIVNWLDEREDENTTVVIFYSGHGMYAPDDNGDETDGYDEFLIPYDIQYDAQQGWRPDMAIRDDELDLWLDSLESNRIVLIVDSCFSGGVAAGALALNRGLSGHSDPSVGTADLQAGDSFAQDVNQPKRVVLMASAAGQSSWEFSDLEHGAFTYYLLQALSSLSADTNHNGEISAEEAFHYAVNRVDGYVFPRTGEHQTPQISDGIAGEVCLTCPR